MTTNQMHFSKMLDCGTSKTMVNKTQRIPRLIHPKKFAPHIVARSSKLPVDNIYQLIIPCFKESIDHHFGHILILKNTHRHAIIAGAMDVCVERDAWNLRMFDGPQGRGGKAHTDNCRSLRIFTKLKKDLNI